MTELSDRAPPGPASRPRWVRVDLSTRCDPLRRKPESPRRPIWSRLMAPDVCRHEGRRLEDLGGARTARPLVVLAVLGLVAALAVGVLAVGSGLVRRLGRAAAGVLGRAAAAFDGATGDIDLHPGATPVPPAGPLTGEMTTGRYLRRPRCRRSVLIVGGRGEEAQGPDHPWRSDLRLAERPRRRMAALRSWYGTARFLAADRRSA